MLDLIRVNVGHGEAPPAIGLGDVVHSSLHSVGNSHSKAALGGRLVAMGWFGSVGFWLANSASKSDQIG
jgi:hypothetical protein